LLWRIEVNHENTSITIMVLRNENRIWDIPNRKLEW
jgi:hypothetical protein